MEPEKKLKNDSEPKPEKGRLRILNNWALKLLAVVLSFFVWVIVVNVNDPLETVRISGIPVQLVNDEMIKNDGQIYHVVGNQRATVRVNQRRSVTSSRSASDFTATADFRNIYKLNQVPITVTCQNPAVTSEDITLLTPSLEIQTESIKTDTVEIEVITTGEPAEGYTIGDITTSRRNLMVTAPESVINRLRKATVTVDVSGASQSIVQKADIVLRDAYGEDMSTTEDYNADEVLLSVTSVTVNVEILNTTSVNLTALIRDTAKVAKGYRYTGYIVRPDKINVSGMKTILADVSSIEIDDEKLTVSGAAEDVSVEVDIREYLPSGVYLLDDSSTVTVTMRVEALQERTLQIPLEGVEIRNVRDGLNYELLTDTYTITVSGLNEDIDKLASEKLEAYIDLAAYNAPGNYNVSVRVMLPDGFTQVGPATAALKLTAMSSEPAETTGAETASAAESSSPGTPELTQSTEPVGV